MLSTNAFNASIIFASPVSPPIIPAPSGTPSVSSPSPERPLPSSPSCESLTPTQRRQLIILKEPHEGQGSSSSTVRVPDVPREVQGSSSSTAHVPEPEQSFSPPVCERGHKLAEIFRRRVHTCDVCEETINPIDSIPFFSAACASGMCARSVYDSAEI